LSRDTAANDPPDPAGSRPDAILVAVFGFLSIYFTGVFPPHPNVNELSRFQAIVSFSERGTFSIEEELRRFGNHEDKAVWQGRFYSNKAPGLIFAGIPVYRALRLFLPPPQSGTDAIFVLVRIFTVTAVCLLALWRFARLLARAGAGAHVPLILAAVAFGTPFLFYSRSFFSHAWSAALLLLAFERLLEAEEAPRGGIWSAAAAGLFAGWAAISEYPVFLLLPLFFLRALAGWNLRRAFAFAAGAAIPIVLLLFYNAACFGSPWALSTAREAHPSFAELAKRGTFGIGVPSPRILLLYLFHPSRGVLLASPFLIWIAARFLRWWRSRERRADLVFCLAVTLVFFLFMGGYPNWAGGWCIGSRYLVPVLFLAALALALVRWSAGSSIVFAAAAVFSIAHHALLTASFPYFPPTLPWPAATVSSWFLARGFVAPNLGMYAGLSPLASLAVPTLLTVLVVVVALRGLPRTRPPVAFAALAGAAILVLTLLLPWRLGPWEQQWREGTLSLFVSR
jgi:hypothetical protein